MTSGWVYGRAELAQDRSVRVVVVTGEGTSFCSGGNTSWIAGEPDATVDDLRTRMLRFYRAWLSIRSLEVPTIAAVNGAGHRRGTVPRAGLRHPVRRHVGPPRCTLRPPGHARRHRRRLAPLRGGRPPRPPATCC